MQSTLIIKFTDQSKSFVHGFEAGKIWEKLDSNVEAFEMTVHKDNIMVIKDMCKHFNYSYDIRGYVGMEYAKLFVVKKTFSQN